MAKVSLEKAPVAITEEIMVSVEDTALRGNIGVIGNLIEAKSVASMEFVANVSARYLVEGSNAKEIHAHVNDLIDNEADNCGLKKSTKTRLLGINTTVHDAMIYGIWSAEYQLLSFSNFERLTSMVAHVQKSAQKGATYTDKKGRVKSALEVVGILNTSLKSVALELMALLNVHQQLNSLPEITELSGHIDAFDTAMDSKISQLARDFKLNEDDAKVLANYGKALEKALLVDKEKILKEMRAIIAQEDAKLASLALADAQRLEAKRAEKVA